MNKSGTVFKACIAHHYWHHMDDPKRFFKIMIGDFKNGVTIPEKFVANIREQISEQVTLKVPNGKTYTVEVAKEQQNKLVLRSGWAEFVSAYKLKQGDLLVFKNSGNSHLKVRIFDLSGCEKELSCVLLDSTPCSQERKGSHGKQMQSPTGKRLAVGSQSRSRKTPKMNPTDSPSQKKRHVSPTKRRGVAKPPCMLPRHTSLTDEQRSKVEEKVGAIQSETTRMNPTDSPSQKKRHVSPTKRHAVAKPANMLPQHKSLTDEQRSKVEEKVGAIQSGTPKMNRTDSPSQKKAEHVPSSEGIHQEPMNSSAYQKLSKSCIVLPTGRGITSEKKAKVVALEQKIQAKARCTQERRVSHGKQMQSPTVKRLAVGSPTGSTKTPKMNPTASPSQKKTEHVPSSEGIHQEPIHLGASEKLIKSCIALPTGCSMTSEQKAKVIALEQKIQPKVPFYITAMHKKTLDSGILAIPKEYVMEHLTNENGTIQLCQLDGSNVWTINLDITTDGDYAVSTGWMDFIHDNKLGEGDICIFEPARSKNRVKLIFSTLEESRCLRPPGFSAGHVSSTKRHGVAKPPYMLPCKTSLTDEQRSKVEKRVRAIQSEIPIYVAVMTNSNVNIRPYILNFGAVYAREYLPSESENQLTMRLQRKDNAWEPEFRAKNGRHLILGEGWKKFVTDNRLKLDDICLFNLRKKTNMLTMDVHIIRK